MARPLKRNGKIVSKVAKRALRQLLLDKLATGSSVREFCAELSLVPSTVRKWRQRNPQFREAYDKAKAHGRGLRHYVVKEAPEPAERRSSLGGAPYDWAPRPHQQALWTYLKTGGKRAVAVWHRRAGKDSVALNFAAWAAQQRVANYWHMLPTALQGRKVVWESIDGAGRRMIDQAFPPSIRVSTTDDEMRIRLVNGSTWQVVGSDNFDRLVGGNPAGVVFSEWALADPRAWDFLRPILAENGGWAMFIYTPRGRNHGATMLDIAKDAPGWFAERLTVDDTGIIPATVIEDERRSGMAEELIQQEYYCSFQAVLVGAYYGPAMEEAEREHRIGTVPYDRDLPVITAWDLGIGDSTSIWFAQLAGREIRLIDYHEASGVGLEHYARVLTDKAYRYSETLLPHDARQRELANGRTRIETIRRLGIIRPRIVANVRLDDGINAARVILPRCWFDAERCARGIEALRQYRRAWDDERRIFADRPLHDWASHAADAFRYLAVGLREPRESDRLYGLNAHQGAPALAIEEDRRPYPTLPDGRPLRAVTEE